MNNIISSDHDMESFSLAAFELQNAVQCLSWTELAKLFCRVFQSLLRADNCVFVLNNAADILSTQSCQDILWWEGDRLRCRKVPNEPIAVGRAKDRSCTTQSAEMWREIPSDFITQRRKPALPSGFYNVGDAKIIWIPLGDHHGRYRGAVIAVRSNEPFDERDKRLANLTASFAGYSIEQYNVMYSVNNIRRELQQIATPLRKEDSPKFGNMLLFILEEARRLFGATHGDIGFCDWKSRKFRLHMPKGDCKWADHDWEGPPRGFVRKYWDLGGSAVIPDVKDDLYKGVYSSCYEGTRSEMLIRLDVPMGEPTSAGRRRVAILNLESDIPGRFDERDERLLQLFAYYVTQEFQSFGVERFYESIIDSIHSKSPPISATGQPDPDKYRDLGRQILVRIRDAFGYDQGIIYQPDFEQKKLLVFANIGDPPDAANPFGYELKADARSFANYMYFRSISGAEFVANPHDGKYPFDTEGLRKFGISQDRQVPMIGLRIEDHNGPIGVMLLWGRTNPGPKSNDLPRLRPFARLSAVVLRAVESNVRQGRFRDKVGGILRSMQNCLELETNLQKVIDGVRAIGFDRVRIFEYRYGNSMCGFMQSGMEEPYASDFVKGYTYDASNQYYQDFMRRCRLGGEHLFPCIYDPSGPAGPDPQAAVLDKPKTLEWVGVPLVSAGKLYGELAADNRYSLRKITDDDREYINTFAALAARAFAIREKRGMLSASGISTLHTKLNSAKSERDLIELFLRYARSEGGLDFTRAFYFRYDLSASVFCFEAAAGPIDRNEFDSRKRDSSRMRKVLENDLQEVDPSAVTWGAIGIPDIPLVTIKNEAGTANTGFELTSNELIKSTGSSKLLAVMIADRAESALISKDGIEGLLIVDKEWQESELSEYDKAVLGTFSQEAARSLSYFRLKENMLRISKSTITHDAKYAIEKIEKVLTGIRQEWALEWQTDIKDIDAALFKLNGLEDLARMARDSNAIIEQEEFSLKSFFEHACLSDKDRINRPELDFGQLDWVLGHRAAVQRVLENLITNALAVKTVSNVTVTAVSRQADDGTWQIEVTVSDLGGPGLSDSRRKEFEDDSRLNTDKLGDKISRLRAESGRGLLLCEFWLRAINSKLILEQNNGGHWSRFRFAFGVKPRSKLTVVETGQWDFSNFGPVLVVEDNEDWLPRLTQHLLRWNFRRVMACNRGEDAIEIVKLGLQDLIILMDIHLKGGGIDGYAAVQLIRNSIRDSKQQPLIICTSRTEDVSSTWRQLGFDGFLPKDRLIANPELLDAILAKRATEEVQTSSSVNLSESSSLPILKTKAEELSKLLSLVAMLARVFGVQDNRFETTYHELKNNKSLVNHTMKKQMEAAVVALDPVSAVTELSSTVIREVQSRFGIY